MLIDPKRVFRKLFSRLANLRTSRFRRRTHRCSFSAEVLEHRCLLAGVWGYVWNDLDLDGQWDTGEENGLDNHTVFVDANGNGTLDTGETITTTSPNGYYQLDNLPLHTECSVALENRSGWRQSWPQNPDYHTVTLTTSDQYAGPKYFGNAQGTIYGWLWEDVDLDGTYDDGESALSGWTVYLDGNSNGSLDTGETTATTDGDGYYALGGLSSGTTYRVAEVVPSGWEQTWPGSPAYYDVTLSDTALWQDKDFGNAQGTIYGWLWEDVDLNGTYDDGESALSGWTVYLDGNSNGSLDTGETTATTDGDGYYALGGLSSGTTYRVAEVVPSGWEQTWPGSPAYYDVTLSDTALWQDKDFGNAQGTIYGWLWEDVDLDGTYDDGESALSGWTVYLDGNSNGSLDTGETTATTDGDGYYALGGLSSGTTYRVAEVVPSGWEQTWPGSPAYYDVTLSDTALWQDKDFGNAQGTIYGWLWEDVDLNGTYDDGESALSGWTVYLDGNSNGSLDTGETTATTDGDGYYIFGGLSSGTTYRVVEVVPSGWEQTWPGSPAYYDVTLSDTALWQDKDFGNAQGTIYGWLWEDVDLNGTYDDGESALSGWTVYLDGNSNGSLDTGETTATTDGDGYYIFGGLSSGTTYRVAEVVPSGWEQTWPGSPAYYDVTLSDTALWQDKDFGNAQGTIYGWLWEDVDLNGTYDDGESALSGWTVYLDGNSNGSLDTGETTATTDGDGYYIFGGLSSGTTYRVAEVVPSGWEQTWPGSPAYYDVTLSDTALWQDKDFGNAQGTIYGWLWEDVDLDGTYDDGESALSGWTVYLDGNSNGSLDTGETTATTDGDGYYIFGGLSSGTTYRVAEVVPSGWEQTWPGSPAYYDVTLSDTALWQDKDFGNAQGTIYGWLWEDVDLNGTYDDGESALSGWTVYLDGNSNGSLDTGETTATTDGDGYYALGGLSSGTTYRVAEVVPSGWEQTWPGSPAYYDVTLSDTALWQDKDFGNAQGTIYGWLWEDVDLNGTYDDGESALSGWTVYLDGNSNGSLDTGETTATTDGDGYYIFGGLSSGTTYRVVEVVPSGWEQTWPGSPAYYDVTLSDTALWQDKDFGNAQGTIYGWLWEDVDLDGTYDDGESALSGWTVYLDGNSNGSLDTGETTATTDGDGYYIFGGLSSGTTYRVAEVVPSGWEQTWPGSPAYYDVTLSDTALWQDKDFGNAQGTIYGWLWEDVDLNGTYDDGESALSGWTVYLDGNSNGSLDTGETTATTDGDGYYALGGLSSGTTYRVVEVVPSGWEQTWPGSPAYYDVTLSDTALWQDKDFGNAQGTIYGWLWEDVDLNGTYDDGESALSGWTVYLDGNSNGSLDTGETTATTDGDGYYALGGLSSGTTYRVAEVVPSGWEQTWPGSPAYYDVTLSDTALWQDKDFGNAQGTIYGWLWEDVDLNGTYDDGESALSGWTVYLDGNSNGSLDTGETTATTDGDGYYIFGGLSSGTTYRVVEVVPSGWEQTWPGSPAYYDVTLSDTALWQDKDFGNAQGTIYGWLWEDVDLNGTYDDGESALSGWTVYLDGNSNGSLDTGETTATTDGDGYYIFGGLSSGTTYRVAEVVPSGWEQTWPGSPAYYDVTLSDTALWQDKDFGNAQGTIYGWLWEDVDLNGTYDDGESALSGWTVYLDGNSNGSLDTGETTATTDGDGYYALGGLSSGTTYRVAEVVPSGWEQTWPGSPAYYDVTLSDTALWQDKDFGNAQGTIYGWLWEDVDLNGTYDDGESALSGWTVYLDGNSNGSLDTGETTATTDGDGYYALGGLSSGTTYRVAEVVPSGWEQTWPGSPAYYDVTLSDTALWQDKDFGNAQGVTSEKNTDTIGLYDPSSSTFFLRNSNTAGIADTVFGYGPAGLGWGAVSGDWNGDGGSTVGLYNASLSEFYLKNTHNGGVADVVFGYGPAGSNWVPVAGDWDGDGTDTLGLYNQVTSTFYLKNSHSGGVADIVFEYGPAGSNWVPVAGDWDGDGDDTLGFYNQVTSQFYLKNSHSGGMADIVFAYGPAGSNWVPLAGDWDGDGDDTLGLYDSLMSQFYLKNSHSGGVADIVFAYGPVGSGWVPLTGDWTVSSAIQLDVAPLASPVSDASLAESDLAPIVETAIGLWADAGVSANELPRLEDVEITIADLPGSYLALTSARNVVVDVDGAGYGWYTGGLNAEFGIQNPESAESRVDLLTVVAHELGHVLGLGHDAADDVMEPLLPLGVRRLPGPEEIDAAFASDWDGYLLE